MWTLVTFNKTTGASKIIQRLWDKGTMRHKIFGFWYFFRILFVRNSKKWAFERTYTRSMPMLTILMVLGIQGSVVQQVFAVCVCCTALVSCQNYMSKLYPTDVVPGVTKRGAVKITFTVWGCLLREAFWSINLKTFLSAFSYEAQANSISWTLIRMILPLTSWLSNHYWLSKEELLKFWQKS